MLLRNEKQGSKGAGKRNKGTSRGGNMERSKKYTTKENEKTTLDSKVMSPLRESWDGGHRQGGWGGGV